MDDEVGCGISIEHEPPHPTQGDGRPRPRRVARRELDTERAAIVLLRPPFDPGNHASAEQERADVLERAADVLGRARDVDELVLQAMRPRASRCGAPARFVLR